MAPAKPPRGGGSSMGGSRRVSLPPAQASAPASAPSRLKPSPTFVQRMRRKSSTSSAVPPASEDRETSSLLSAVAGGEEYDEEMEGMYKPCAKGLLSGKSWMRRPVTAGVDAAMLSSVRKAVKMVGNVVADGLRDPNNPASEHLVAAFWKAWGGLSAFIDRELLEKYSHKRARFRKSLLQRWSRGRSFWLPGAWLPQPYTWLRAVLLYALFPADKGVTPTFLIFLLTSLAPLFGLEIWFYALIFIMIDKRDEYQLVNYVCLFKTVQFLACGIYPAIAQSIEHFFCLNHVYAGHPEECTGMPANMRLQFAAEPLRYGCIAAAFALLLLGYAYGGAENAAALEAVRIDLADGDLDGAGSAVASGSKKRQRPLGRLLPWRRKAAASTADAPEPPPPSVIRKAQAAARVAVGAKRRRGGVFVYFIAYDMAVTLAVALGTVLTIVLAGYGWSDWIVWEAFELARELQSLLSFPFLILAHPTLLRLLTDAVPTGYDAAGTLCQQLTPTQLRLLKKARGTDGVDAGSAAKEDGSFGGGPRPCDGDMA